MQELFDTAFGPCLNTLMLLLKLAPRLCSATTADMQQCCYQDTSAALFLKFHTRNAIYKVFDQGNVTQYHFQLSATCPWCRVLGCAQAWLNLDGFCCGKICFLRTMQVLGSLFVLSSDKTSQGYCCMTNILFCTNSYCGQGKV